MKKTIVVAGATGNLGERIVQSLLKKGAEVRVIVRENSDSAKVSKLEKLGAKVFKINMLNIDEVTKACVGVDCVVSALAGLQNVIIDTQKVLLDAAVLAGVPRFIPSDYSLDFTKFKDGENRNLDLRRTFHTYLDNAPIASTTIFNSAFMDMLTNEMPLILFKQKRILYWGNIDHKMAFTTVQNVAEFTANAALDPSTPRFLHIAGDQLSPREFQTLLSDLTGEQFGTIRPGSLKFLSGIIKIARFFNAGAQDLYPAWQGMQYMRNMIDDRSNLNKADTNRYADVHWTTVKDLISAHLKK
jgi:nucleoside-diphosphate-sugar epimerase